MISVMLSSYFVVIADIFAGCFFFVGGKLPGETRPHHKSVFDFDEVKINKFYRSTSFLCKISINSTNEPIILFSLF